MKVTPFGDAAPGLPDLSPKHLFDKWTEDERNRHKRTSQLAHHVAGIAVFYHSTARFVGWLAQIDAPEIWIGSAPKLDQPDNSTASNLVALGQTHRMLIQEFNNVEGVKDPPADAAHGYGADERHGDGPRPAAPLLLPPLHKLASEDADASSPLPEQRRATAQMMHPCVQHKAIGRSSPDVRKCLPCTGQVIDAISRTDEGHMGHLILQQNMRDDEDYHCEPAMNFEGRHPRGSRAFASPAHGR